MCVGTSICLPDVELDNNLLACLFVVAGDQSECQTNTYEKFGDEFQQPEMDVIFMLPPSKFCFSISYCILFEKTVHTDLIYLQ